MDDYTIIVAAVMNPGDPRLVVKSEIQGRGKIVPPSMPGQVFHMGDPVVFYPTQKNIVTLFPYDPQAVGFVFFYIRSGGKFQGGCRFSRPQNPAGTVYGFYMDFSCTVGINQTRETGFVKIGKTGFSLDDYLVFRSQS